MSRLLRATGMVGLPVLTITGESPLEVKDVVFDRNEGSIVALTLRHHGFLGGPAKEWLAWADVRGLGPDAVIVEDESAFRSGGDSPVSSGDVIGDRVITEGGTDLGEVVEVVVRSGRHAEVVGFEIEGSAAIAHDSARHVFLPLPETLAMSGENIVVPDEVTEFVRDDISGFGAAVEGFRSRLAHDADAGRTAGGS